MLPLNRRLPKSTPIILCTLGCGRPIIAVVGERERTSCLDSRIGIHVLSTVADLVASPFSSSRNGLVPLPGVSPHKCRIRGRAEYFCSCSPATWLLQDSPVCRTLSTSICSSRLVASRYYLNTGPPVSGVGQCNGPAVETY